MQPYQPFLFGGPPQSQYTGGHFQNTSFFYGRQRSGSSVVPSPRNAYRCSSFGGQQALIASPLQQQQQQQLRQQQQQQFGGVNVVGSVLPSLHGTHLLPQSKVALIPGGNVPQVPVPPPSTSVLGYQHRSSGCLRPQQMGYPGNSSYQRSMPMCVKTSGSPVYSNSVNGHVGGAGMQNLNTCALNEVTNGSIASGRSEISLKSINGSVPRVANLPTLQINSSSTHTPRHAAPSKSSIAVHTGFTNGGVVPLYGTGGLQAGLNGLRGDYNELSRSNVGSSTLTTDLDVHKGRDSESATPDLLPISNSQSGCHVNTPPERKTDSETGLTPTPPFMSCLTRYEEEEVREYLPYVYFGGTENCKKICGARGMENNDGFDDDTHHYRVVVGDHLAYRYEVIKVLGQGTFGIVVSAFDHKHRRQVAVKIIKNKPNYTKQAREEIKTLEMLKEDDPDDDANIVRLLASHIFRNHYLLVFELLPTDLYAVIQSHKFSPMTREFIFDLSEQLLTALVHVRQHGIVHCDLKPENIMISKNAGHSSSMADSPSFSLKLIDFGSACEEQRPVFTYIQSRYYRAPEIVLGIRYTTAIDMWSFGCVLCELANGYPIFPASSEGELLERIVEYLGSIPSYLVQQGRRADRFFEDGQMKYNLGKKRAPHPPGSRVLRNFLKLGQSREDILFENFVASCLRLDARERLTPELALDHPWMEYWRGSSSYNTSSSRSL